MANDWQRLAPTCADMLAKRGVAGRAATFADFVWAHTIFWRAPAPPRGNRPRTRAPQAASCARVPGCVLR